jgi:PAS domain S-box-containing protein
MQRWGAVRLACEPRLPFRRLKLALDRKIVLGLGTALLVLFLVTAVSWWNVARSQRTQFWVGHSREVLSQLEQLLTDVLGMQASARGFVLTGSEEVLQPFTEGSAQIENSLKDIRLLISGDPGQLERLARLEPLVVRAREIMAGRIEARRLRGLDAASEAFAYLEGQRVVDSLRAGIREMVTEERRLLDERLTRNTRVNRLTVVTILASTVIAAVLVIAAGVRVRRDLVRRQKAETALQESFARVEDLYNKAPCGYHSLDREGKFVAINDTALAWLGRRREEVVGRMSFSEVLTPRSGALFHERFEHFKRLGAVQNVEYEWQRPGGGVRHVLLNATAIYDATGRYVASRATIFDVTERKQVEAERDRFFMLSRDLLCIASLDGYFKRVNPAWQDTLGFTAEELQAAPFPDFVHPEDRERTLAELERLGDGKETIDFENRYRAKDGSYRWLRWGARAVPEESLVFASARDVTESKESEERIRRLNLDLALRAQQLEAANRELESFSYSVSHDLRAPLRHIDGFAALLTKRAADALDAEGQRYVATISKAARQMGMLIDDLLAFSRIGRADLRFEPVDHDALVAGVVEESDRAAAGPKVQWTVEALPRVRADAAMLRQVWVNLIGNAVKYSGKSPAPRIAIAARRDEERGEFIFTICDNGVGFDMAYADKLFGVFQRLHGSKEFEGTGIGLANVRRIVARHGGRTWAEGSPGAGATFYFSLPLNLSFSLPST